MHYSFGLLSLLHIVLAMTYFAPPADAQQHSLPESISPVRPARFEAPPTTAGGPSVRFGRRPARVGDEIQQTLSLEMRLDTMLRQGNEVKERNQTLIHTHQHLILTTAAVDKDRTTAVLVRYVEATRRAAAGADAATSEAFNEQQPVHGKTYLCRREPGDAGKLIVTDEAGNTPSPEEYEMVSRAMEAVGRANPLAELLAGRTFRVGETIPLPNELASRFFNLSDAFGEVVKFELTMRGVRNEAAIPCAIFQAKVEAVSHGPSQMRMAIQGPFIVEIATCRAAQVELAGPIAMTESRGTYSTAYQILATGNLSMNVASAYADAER